MVSCSLAAEFPIFSLKNTGPARPLTKTTGREGGKEGGVGYTNSKKKERKKTKGRTTAAAESTTKRNEGPTTAVRTRQPDDKEKTKKK